MRARATLAITCVTLALTSACTVGQATAELAGYRPTPPNSNQLTVIYEEGEDDGPGHGDVVKQDANQVQVRVKYKRSDETNVLIGVYREAVVTLKEPLGSRRVVDQDGKPLAVKNTDDLPSVIR